MGDNPRRDPFDASPDATAPRAHRSRGHCEVAARLDWQEAEYQLGGQSCDWRALMRGIAGVPRPRYHGNGRLDVRVNVKVYTVDLAQRIAKIEGGIG